MSFKRHQLDHFKRYLLNRGTAAAQIVEYIENCSLSEDEANKHSFHKIIVHNWATNDIQLFDTICDYFGSLVIPINCTSQGDIITFYTSNVNLILKIIRFDFMFPFNRNMFNVDVLFNDKSSVDFFENSITIEDIVNGIVCRRFSEKCELDLSDFCNDQEFKDKRINFYKLTLLGHFKTLMLRMGKDTKTLNLSNNNLSQAPIEILNFFIKGDLIAINLSNNNIPSLKELQRVTSKIEKLWIEGNPLCEELDPLQYIKDVTVKFPRLTELDGVKLNQHDMTMPFFRNYLGTPDRKTKMLVEKFVILYFSHFDSHVGRKKVLPFYDDKITLTFSSDFNDNNESFLTHYRNCSRNILHPKGKADVLIKKKCYKKHNVITVFNQFPTTVHDMSTFTVDVLHHDKKSLILVIDGIFKEKETVNAPDKFFQFRRTFVFTIYRVNDISVYHIINEMFHITLATEEQKSSFKAPIKNMNALSLFNPEYEESDAICRAFQNLTQLKKSEAELRLKYHNWDIREALKEVISNINQNKIPGDRFIEDDDFSDTSSLLDEID